MPSVVCNSCMQLVPGERHRGGPVRPAPIAFVRIFAAVAAVAVVAAGCSRAGSGSAQSSASASATASASQAASTVGDFGTLKNVCHGGTASGATAQGVTSDAIQVGVMTDQGFTKDPQLADAAKAFASWCNAAGGIDGRKLVANLH